MKLLIDIGNTATKFAYINQKSFSYIFRIYNFEISEQKIKELFSSFDYEEIYVSSVAPKVYEKLDQIFFSLFNKRIKKIDLSYNNVIKINIDNPSELGVDLLCDLVAAKEKYDHSVAVIDFGTATKILFIDQKGEFSSCAIFLGFSESKKILSSSTELLPNVSSDKVKKISESHNTVDVINSSAYYSQLYSVKGIIKKYEEETGIKLKLIVTGGNGKDFYSEFKNNEIEESLSLQGLAILIRGKQQ